MFSLTREEIMNLSQSVISSKIKHAPNVFVFTEQGVAMLSSVLNSERAIQVNIHIMRVFAPCSYVNFTIRRFSLYPLQMKSDIGDLKSELDIDRREGKWYIIDLFFDEFSRFENRISNALNRIFDAICRSGGIW